MLYILTYIYLLYPPTYKQPSKKWKTPSEDDVFQCTRPTRRRNEYLFIIKAGRMEGQFYLCRSLWITLI